MVDVGKSRMEDFRQKRLISIEISFHALIKKNNDKSFGHVMQKNPKQLKKMEVSKWQR